MTIPEALKISQIMYFGKLFHLPKKKPISIQGLPAEIFSGTFNQHLFCLNNFIRID